jgi:hypothetical protein
LLYEGYYYGIEELLSGISPTISGSELAEEGQTWLGLFETIEEIQHIDIDQQKRKLIR